MAHYTALVASLFTLLHYFRSDAQRTAKQKERKEQELEKCRFNAEIMDDPSIGANVVSRTKQTYSIILP